MALNPTDACGLKDQSIPQWKRELILRRRALGRTLQVGSSTVKLTCPAVVAIVRQPEVVNISENVTTSKQRFSSTEDSTLAFSSLNQNRVDFHPSTSSAVSVGNMRLLDACSDVNNLVINGIDVKNKQSEVVSSDLCVNYNLIMGEDKSLNLKKKSAMNKSKFDQSNCSGNRQQIMLLDKVSNEERNGTDEDCLSDSSEELQYGPGIVNKLKTKYLSMTLREQKRNLRPSIINLRRATSLENMLEGEGNINKQTESVVESNVKTDNITINNRTACTGKSLGLSSHRGMRHLGNRSLETMKRARSMDTLLKSESRTTLKNNFAIDNMQNILNNDITQGKPIASIVNENIVIVENISGGCLKETSQQGNISMKDLPKHSKRGGNISVDKELPPPDLVKQTLKIFETSPKKRVKSSTQTNLSKLVTGFSNSASQPLSSVNSRSINKTKPIPNKPSLSPKPILSPEKLRQNRSRVGSPKKSPNIPVSSICSPKVSKSVEKQHLELELSGPTNNTNISPPDRTIAITSPKVTSPRSISPIVTVVSNSEQVSSLLVKQSKTRSSTVQNSHKIEKNSFPSGLNEFEEVDSRECSKPVPESALENIRRGGISMQFSFKNENAQDTAVSKSYLPRPKSPPQALNTLLLKQNHEITHTASIAPLRSQNSPHTKQVGVIRPLVTTKIQPPHSPSLALTEQEIEKNLINRVKSIEQPISKVVVAIKALPDNVVLGSVSPDVVTNKSLSLPRANSKMKAQGLWDEKLWHQNQNTIVFNFSDRKDVPDYIENDGLILRGKRDRPRPGEGGIILLDGACDESSTDAEELLISDPPSPCDVTFEGDNVLINGKSNLKKSPKQVKLRIKFNDEATTMFEYPSEASLVEEMSAQSSTSDEPNTLASPSSGLTMPLGGSLGAYTPRQMGAGEWQLGVTPVQQPPTAPTGVLQPQDEDHLKPAPPESTVVWSEDTASDLLF